MVKSKKSRENFWPRLWRLLKPSKKQIKILFVLSLITELVRLIGPYLLKLIIDQLTNFQASQIKTILSLIALMFLSEQFVSLLHFLGNRRVFALYFDVESYLSIRAQQKLVSLPLSYHEQENTGNKIIKIEKGIQKILDLIGNMAWEVVPTLLQLVVTLIILLIVDWRFGLSFAVFSPLFIIITYKSNKTLFSMRQQRYKNYEIASGNMGQTIININTVKSFVQEDRETSEYKKLREKIRHNGIKEWFKLLKYGLSRDFIIDSGRITVLLLAVYLAWRGQVSIGTLVFVLTLSEKAYFSLYRLSRFYDRVEEGAIAVNRFVNLVNEQDTIINPKDGLKPKTIAGQIEFRNLVFDYRGGKPRALDKVNLKINSGCITALVGPSGGGKTTVARMIYRHYDPSQGSVLLDGVDLKKYDLQSFRKHLAIVPQEVEIFDRSVKNNIAYAKPGVLFKEIEAAAKIANAEEFIATLPQGYNTLVGERGIKLSGGQRQRIGIARAILANPRILIFDEATSHLDSYSEKLIQQAIERVSRGRTVIIIAHRLSTIKKADKIIVLEQGRVVEQGSHYELAQSQGGLYAKLLKLQQLGDVV